MIKKYKVAIVGATGLVGRTVLKLLEEKNLPYTSYILFSSNKSAGSKINFFGRDFFVYELKESSFDLSFDYAIFCTNEDVSRKYIPIAVSAGCIAVDNSNAYRMNNTVPLIIPEVNVSDMFPNEGIISNPNCSTIQAVMALKPLDDNYSIKRIIYSTYQAVSGAGRYGIEDLENKNKGKDLKKFPFSIYNNCLPQIDSFLSDGYTKEEYKMINETRKILHKANLPITATTVRVPVINCHCESINIEFEKEFNIYDIKILLEKSPGIIVIDDIEKPYYPLPSKANNNDEVFVGRIRRDFSVENGINIWVVADNLRKGAATNAVQILQNLIFNTK